MLIIAIIVSAIVFVTGSINVTLHLIINPKSTSPEGPVEFLHLSSHIVIQYLYQLYIIINLLFSQPLGINASN